jgi:pimeloyl-ACP methyl ester carboxylesterase
MSDDFEHHDIELSDVRLHVVTRGAGDPMVLLHGWPETWFEWRTVMPVLAERFHVIAPDMRGLGDSSKPAAGYDAQTVAGDIAELIAHLDVGPCHVVGHDWGGPVAFALAAWNPDLVRTLTIVDVGIPGIGPDFSQGGRRWHHQVHMTPDRPEILIAARARDYYGWFARTFGARPDAVDPAAVDEYLRTYATPDGIRCGLAYYRTLPDDIAANKAFAESGRLTMPVLALGGTGGRGRGMEVIEAMRTIADVVEGGVVEDCGHWMPEEQPDELIARLTAFIDAHG